MVLEAGALRALGNRLEEVLGMPHADALISALPPVDWTEMATRREVARLAVAESVEARFGGLDARLAIVDARFDAVDARFDAVDARFDRLERSVDARFDAVDARFDRLERSLADRFDRLERSVANIHNQFITILSAALVAIATLVVALVELG